MHKLSFALLLFASSLGELTTGIFVPSLIAVGDEFQISNLSLQIILASFIVTLALSQLLAGPVTDHYGRRPVYLSGLAILMLGSCGAGLADSPYNLLFARILQGLGAAAVYVATRGSIRDTKAEADLPRTMGMLIIAFMITAVLSPLLGGVLLDLFGWRATFWFLTFTIGLTFVGVLTSFPETLDTKYSGHLTPKSLLKLYRSLFSNPQYRKYATIHSFGYASFYIFVAALPLLGRDLLDIGPTTIGGILSAITIGMIIGVVSASSIAKKYGMNLCIGMGLTFATLGTGFFLTMALLNASIDLQLIVISQGFAAFGGGLVSPHTSSQTLLHQPNRAGLASAGLGFFSMTLAGLGMVIMGYIYSASFIEVAALQVGFTLLSCIPFAVGIIKNDSIPTNI